MQFHYDKSKCVREVPIRGNTGLSERFHYFSLESFKYLSTPSPADSVNRNPTVVVSL